MKNNVFVLLTESLYHPTALFKYVGKLIAVIGFLSSVSFLVMGCVSFNDGAWALLIAGLLLISIFIYILRNYSSESLFYHSMLCLTRAMISASLLVVILGFVGGGIGYFHNIYQESVTKENIEKEEHFKANPAALVEYLIGRQDIGAEFKKNKSSILIKYNLDDWALTYSTAASSFNLHVTKLVPDFFYRYPDVEIIKIIGTGVIVDKKGNSYRDDVVYIVFSRAEASTIKWNNISYSNIPEIADSYWIHP